MDSLVQLCLDRSSGKKLSLRSGTLGYPGLIIAISMLYLCNVAGLSRSSGISAMARIVHHAGLAVGDHNISTVRQGNSQGLHVCSHEHLYTQHIHMFFLCCTICALLCLRACARKQHGDFVDGHGARGAVDDMNAPSLWIDIQIWSERRKVVELAPTFSRSPYGCHTFTARAQRRVLLVVVLHFLCRHHMCNNAWVMHISEGLAHDLRFRKT